MVEGGAKEAREKDVLAALQFAHREILPIIDAQEELAKRVGKAKLQVPGPVARRRPPLPRRCATLAEARLRDALRDQGEARALRRDRRGREGRAREDHHAVPPREAWSSGRSTQSRRARAACAS